MLIKCKNCLPKSGIDIPDFTQSEKEQLVRMAIDSPLLTVKFMIDNYKISHMNAKYIATHINEVYGKCNRCVFDKLAEECVSCPKCGALNLNWKIIE